MSDREQAPAGAERPQEVCGCQVLRGQGDDRVEDEPEEDDDAKRKCLKDAGIFPA